MLLRRNCPMSTVRWIDSNGGPLVFMPVEVVSTWGGIQKEGSQMTDYDRACTARDEIAIITLRH
ncbi:Imm21 family immunity protein [Pendulispora rubella]|uniref:Imm21 family immunity protein n=1 Tax=Pendulispora rubella TaxID=2741070 RepID=UPI00374E16AF